LALKAEALTYKTVAIFNGCQADRDAVARAR
jgi:hypothetical protein